MSDHSSSLVGKGDSNKRLTYLLRPNVRKPDYGAVKALETPPITDADSFSQLETTDIDSDLVSDRDFTDSDAERAHTDEQTAKPAGHLGSIEEVSLPSSPHLAPKQWSSRGDDEWSMLSGDAGTYGDDSSSEAGQDLLDSVASLSLDDTQAHTARQPLVAAEAPQQRQDPDETLTQDAVNLVRGVLVEGRESPLGRVSHFQQHPHLPNRRWARSTSSPSRSPVRIRRLTSARKKRQALHMRIAQRNGQRSFYDYLFT